MFNFYVYQNEQLSSNRLKKVLILFRRTEANTLHDVAQNDSVTYSENGRDIRRRSFPFVSPSRRNSKSE